ncbi:unnamed protein product [Ostreobium quekettii]|uniref:Cytochrome P450 n=1 Tax=Ostreobium quekettii TaxID=121088 RepID=A0A8S1J091_9CHLO|nr:unnamed protein product [Ostreobium quekettii]
MSCLPFIVDTAKQTCAEFEGRDWFPLTEEVRSALGRRMERASSPSEIMAILHAIADSVFTLGIDLPFTKYRKGVKGHEEMTAILEESIRAMERHAPTDGQPTKALRRILDAEDDDGNGIDMAVIVNTVIVLLSAGYDTVSSTMDTIFHGLALNPQVWDNLREEQRRVTERFGSDITLKSLDAMVYAMAVVKEGLRAQPMVPFVFKRVEESVELGGYQIPVGTQIIPGAGFTTRHLDGRWSDGDAFRPERYLEPEADNMGSFAPFGMGAHTCLGKELGLIQMRVLLAVLARDYEVRLRDPHSRVEKFPFPHAEDGCMATVRRLRGGRA